MATKKRILFVDDNPILLEVYTLTLETERATWDVATASSAQAALELMERSPVDVLVSDMRMPGMDGLQLAEQARLRHPGAARIILSGMSDQEEVARCLGTTHQFLAKPINAKALKATLARIGALDSFLQDQKLKSVVTQLGGLPSFPSLYLEITKELSAEDPSMERIASIVAKDPSMIAKMLQTVNSAAFGLPREIADPFEAVQFLGLCAVRSVVLSSQLFSFYGRQESPGFSVDRLWSHSMRTARRARRLLGEAGADLAEADDGYIAGMVHDLGKLMLAHSLPAQFQQAVKLSGERKMPLDQAEVEVFGATHAGVAAYLLGLWGLPAPIVEAVAFHHTPARSDLRAFGPLAAVHVASGLEQLGCDGSPAERPHELDLDYLEEVGVQDRLESWSR